MDLRDLNQLDEQLSDTLSHLPTSAPNDLVAHLRGNDSARAQRIQRIHAVQSSEPLEDLLIDLEVAGADVRELVLFEAEFQLRWRQGGKG
jgi:hypothetical protein